jgi:Beta-propeller repeat
MFAQPSLNSARAGADSRPRVLLAICLLLAVLLPISWRSVAPASPAAHAQPNLGSLPLTFIPTGDLATPFSAFSSGGSIAFQPGAVSLARPGSRLRVEFTGANPDASLLPAERQPGVFNRHIGADPAKWRDNIPSYAALVYQELFPGVDLRYDGQAGQLKGTYTVAPQASPANIRWSYAGAAHVAIVPASGDIQISLPGGELLHEHAPVAWQDVGGQREIVPARFALDGAAAHFELGAYDPNLPLVIDPTLAVGTFLGGSGADYGRGIAVDKQGNIYVVGDFFSSDFLGDNTTTSGSKDVIVLKLNPAGTELIYGWFMGGAGADEGLAITVNSAGEAFVLIDPDTDFPLKNAPISTRPSVGDGVLAKFTAAGQLAYSTYIGFGLSNIFTGNAIAIGPDGALYITGETYIAIHVLHELAFARVNPSNGKVTKLFATSGAYPDSHGAAIALDPDGTIYLTGATNSRFGTDFPTTPDAAQPICGRKQALGPDRDCDSDAFVLVFDQNFSVRYASYLGGNGGDEGRGIAVDRQGNVIVTGTAFSADFPVKNAIQSSCPVDPSSGGCSYDSFVTKFAADGGVVYSSYLTSSEPEAQTFATDVVVDKNGNAYVYGFTNGTALPIKNAVQPARSTGLCLGGFDRFCFDTFVTELAPDGSLIFGTYLGGALDEYSGSIAVDQAGAIYMVGYTESTNFPVSQGSVQPEKSIAKDFFVAKIRAGGVGGGPDLPHKIYVPSVRR